MEVGSSSSSVALAAAPQTAQTASELVGRPYHKRAKNAVLNDPTLEQVMGSKEKALDFEEFPENGPLNLDNTDKGHWTRLRKALFDEEKVRKAAKHTNPRSFGSELAHTRHTLRLLKDVAAGTREKFEISGSQPKRAPRAPKANGIAKAKRTKSTKARDNHPSQHGPTSAVPSSSAAGENGDDNTDAMNYTLTDAVSSPAEDDVFETVEERAANDEAMRKEAVRIRKEFPALNNIPPETMKTIGHLVDLGLW